MKRRIRLFPCKTLTIESHLTSDEIKNFLREETETTYRFGTHPYSKSNMTGEVSSDRFKLSWIFNVSGFFLTTMEGRITPKGHGATIKIRVTLNQMLQAVLSILFGALLVWMLKIAYAGLTRSAPMDGMLIPLCILVFVYLLSLFGFYVDLGIYETFLHSNLDKKYR